MKIFQFSVFYLRLFQIFSNPYYKQSTILNNIYLWKYSSFKYFISIFRSFEYKQFTIYNNSLHIYNISK